MAVMASPLKSHWPTPTSSPPVEWGVHPLKGGFFSKIRGVQGIAGVEVVVVVHQVVTVGQMVTMVVRAVVPGVAAVGRTSPPIS